PVSLIGAQPSSMQPTSSDKVIFAGLNMVPSNPYPSKSLSASLYHIENGYLPSPHHYFQVSRRVIVKDGSAENTFWLNHSSNVF
ncbi:MAG TPA: hypothetical protein VH985_00920, partial [Candidatus Binatia bacterium]